jgi:predicted GNAT family N-acyltransferase
MMERIDAKDFYKTYKKEYLKWFEEQTGLKALRAEFHDDNNPFKILVSNYQTYFSGKSNNLSQDVLVEESSIQSYVEHPKDPYVKSRNSLVFSLPCGSHLRLCTYKEKSLEISRVIVNGKQRRSGVGSLLMKITLDFIKDSLGYIPTIFIECLGAVGAGENYQHSNISIQTAFFRKFGFKANDRKYYPNYISMIRNKQQ